MSLKVRILLALSMVALLALLLPAGCGEVDEPADETLTTVGALTTVGTATSAPEPPSSTTSLSTTTSERQLYLPDLTPQPIDQLFIVATRSGRELWFSSSTANIGDGPLEMIGSYDAASGAIRAVQRIAARDGGPPEVREVGLFVYHESHEHWHFEDYFQLDIIARGNAGSAGSIVATTGKMTFCIHDRLRLTPPLPGSPESEIYTECDAEVQGISVGWVDLYDADLPGQQISIEHLADGRYLLRLIADPDDRIMEKNEANNIFEMQVEITGTRVERLE